MRELANYGDRYVGLKNVADLAAWMKAVAPQLAGYQQFASPRSKQDIEQGNWSWRWAKSHFESVWKHRVGGVDHNAKVKADARWRLFAALNWVCVDVNIGVTALWQCLSAIAKSCFDKGVAWKTFEKYRAEVIEKIKHPDRVGLSTGIEEDINSFSRTSVEPETTKAKSELKNTTQQLLTHRCVIAIYSSIFSQFYTPKLELTEQGDGVADVETEVPSDAEDAEEASECVGLAVGQTVRIAMPGGSLDEVEARIAEQTIDVLGQRVYRLDYQHQGRAVTLPAECLQKI